MASKESRKVNVTIRIDRDRATELDRIVRDLQASGLGAVDVHRRFLIVNGSVPAGSIASLRKVPGVSSVRGDRTYKIA